MSACHKFIQFYTHVHFENKIQSAILEILKQTDS